MARGKTIQIAPLRLVSSSPRSEIDTSVNNSFLKPPSKERSGKSVNAGDNSNIAHAGDREVPKKRRNEVK
jgi:hypothetical protein